MSREEFGRFYQLEILQGIDMSRVEADLESIIWYQRKDTRARSSHQKRDERGLQAAKYTRQTPPKYFTNTAFW